VFVGFMSTYFLSKGMSNSLLSMVLALYMITSFTGSFFWSSMCDKFHTNKKIFVLIISLSIVCGVSCFMSVSYNLYLASFLYVLFGFLCSSIGTNIDAWVLRSYDYDAEIYSSIRAMGSIGYALSMLVGGQLINIFGYTTILVLFTILGCLALMLGLSTKEKEYIVKHHERVNYRDLFKQHSYMMMVMIVFLMGLSVTPLISLKTVIIQDVGGDVGLLGIDQFVGLMTQGLFIYLAKYTLKINLKVRMLLMSLLLFISMVLTAIAPSSLLVIIGTAFNNMSYGFMLPTMREVTDKCVDSHMLNTAYGLTDAAFSYISGVVALLYSGVLIDNLGSRSVSIVGGIIMVVVMVMCYFYKLGGHKDEKDA